MQSVSRTLLKQMLEADWAETSYGTILAGPRVGEKRKMTDGGAARGKRFKAEESSDDDDSDW